MQRNVTPIMRPHVVAVIGASATRVTQGNQVIGNLQQAGFKGRILPVHASAETIAGLPVIPRIADLPAGTDVAVLAIPVAGVAGALAELEQAGVAAAVVFSNGFSPEQVQDFRRVSDTSRMAIHGPNCMGLIDLHEAMPLYPATITAKVRRGTVALLAQSGSAAISLMNSSSFGISTVVTMGSEFQVTAPDYLRFFADDPRTAVIGVVIESIQRPSDFAHAVAQVHAAGKSIVVLKVGRSEVGNRAVQAHTGAMISRSDAYERFFARHAVPMARDYDELIATLECFAATSRVAGGTRMGIVGISGGETALACDVAADLGLMPATFSAETTGRIVAALHGAAGSNPLDMGATVGHTPDQDSAAIRAILDAPEVDTLLFIQDAQASLTPTMLNNYTPHIREYARLAASSRKPVVMISPSAENTHPAIHAMMEQAGVPVLRGMRAGLAALRNLGTLGQARTRAAQPDGTHRPSQAAARLREQISGHAGPLPTALVREVLAAYDLPLVRSVIVATADAAVGATDAIGYPLVLKIVSPDIPHRSDVGGVELGIADAAGLHTALARMTARIAAALPQAEITGFELQEQLTDWVEAMTGFVAAPPFGALLTVGTGGTMVELQADHSVELCPIGPARAAEMIAGTRLGTYLSGYRNLILRTDTAELARLTGNLSRLAADLCDVIEQCDLNPVLVRKGTGEVRIVDALMVGRP